MKTIETIIPEVGMGVTLPCGSDRYPGTIQKVVNGGRVLVITEDRFQRMDKNGFSESQEYAFMPNPGGTQRVFSLRKNGKYVEVGSDLYTGSRCIVGHRSAYQDPHF